MNNAFLNKALNIIDNLTPEDLEKSMEEFGIPFERKTMNKIKGFSWDGIDMKYIGYLHIDTIKLALEECPVTLSEMIRDFDLYAVYDYTADWILVKNLEHAKELVHEVI